MEAFEHVRSALFPGYFGTTEITPDNLRFHVGADLDFAALTPHMAGAWDATHDGRTVLRGSFNQYVDVAFPPCLVAHSGTKER